MLFVATEENVVGFCASKGKKIISFYLLRGLLQQWILIEGLKVYVTQGEKEKKEIIFHSRIHFVCCFFSPIILLCALKIASLRLHQLQASNNVSHHFPWILSVKQGDIPLSSIEMCLSFRFMWKKKGFSIVYEGQGWENIDALRRIRTAMFLMFSEPRSLNKIRCDKNKLMIFQKW